MFDRSNDWRVFLDHCQLTRAKLLKELENLQLELQRLTSWLENDAARYWEGELRQAQRDWVECEQALLRCRSAVRASEQRPCTEQRKRLEQATERRTLCEQQVRFVREATLMWQREKTKIDAKIFRCRDLADSDLTVAINKLKEQLGRLEEYSNLRSGAVASYRSHQSRGRPSESESLAKTIQRQTIQRQTIQRVNSTVQEEPTP